MKLVKGHKLFEDFFDDNLDNTEDEVDSINDTDKEINSQIIDKKEYSHSVDFLVVVKKYDELETVGNHIKGIINRIIKLIDNSYFISEDNSWTIRIAKNGSTWPVNVEPNEEDDKLYQANLFSDHPEEVFAPVIEEYKSKSNGSSVVFDIVWKFDIVGNQNLPTIISFCKLLAYITKYLGSELTKWCRLQVKKALWLDDIRLHIDRTNSLEEETIVYVAHSLLPEEKYPFEMIESYVRRLFLRKQAHGVDVDIPEDFRDSLPQKILNYIEKCGVFLEDDTENGVIRISFPEETTVDMCHIINMFYYARKFYILGRYKDDANYDINITVDGVCTMENKLYERYHLYDNVGYWFESIEYIKKLNCNGTDYSSLCKLLKEVYVHNLNYNNPKSGGSNANNLIRSSNNEEWKNQNINITSDTHDIEFTQSVEKLHKKRGEAPEDVIRYKVHFKKK